MINFESRIEIRIDGEFVGLVDRLCEHYPEQYPSRSLFVRAAIMQLLRKEAPLETKCLEKKICVKINQRLII